MTDEGSAPPPADLAPVPEPPPVEVEEAAPAVEESAPAVDVPEETTSQTVPEAVAEPEAPQAPPAVSSSAPAPQPTPKVSARTHMLEVVRKRKADRLEKIIALARERKVITNDDVEKLLKVSDATATNYLRELVKTGRLKRVGGTFHARYELLSG